MRDKRDFAGIEVSKDELLVALRRDEQTLPLQSFPNTPEGHRTLARYLARQGRVVRVCLESTGVYGLDLSLRLQKQAGVEVMGANPRAVRHFARALMQRSKTDPLDALRLLEFAARMPFQSWQPPSATVLHLCALARLARQARQLIAGDPLWQERFQQLDSIPGIAPTSAMAILAELAMLSPDLGVRQWVAAAGLDPREPESGEHTSGSSVHKKTRISKAGNRHLRRALYMPALVAARHDPHRRAFYQHLLDNGKEKLQAVVAVMRKLLHAIYGMFKHHQSYDGSRLYRIPELDTRIAPLVSTLEVAGTQKRKGSFAILQKRKNLAIQERIYHRRRGLPRPVPGFLSLAPLLP